MASRVIDVALKLRDAFTGPMKGAISSLTSFDKDCLLYTSDAADEL